MIVVGNITESNIIANNIQSDSKGSVDDILEDEEKDDTATAPLKDNIKEDSGKDEDMSRLSEKDDTASAPLEDTLKNKDMNSISKKDGTSLGKI